MLIGITGPTGSGKGVAADFLAQRIQGAVVKPIAKFPDILPPGQDNGGVVIVPDITRQVDAAQIRRHGRLVHIYGRGSGGPDVEIDNRDFLVGNHAGKDQLFRALDDIARAVTNDRV